MLGKELVDIDYQLNERMAEIEESYTPMEPGGLRHWEERYRKAEGDLMASLGSTETILYLRAKSKLLSEHSKNIS